jgi:hypothetical protein
MNVGLALGREGGRNEYQRERESNRAWWWKLIEFRGGFFCLFASIR